MIKLKLKRRKNKKFLLNNRTKIILLVIFIVIDIFLIYSFIRVREAVNINQLNNEFYDLLEVNFTSGDYDNKVNTSGKYGVVEKAMIDYFKDYSDKTKEILKVVNDKEFTNLLSVENYNSEDKEFKEDINYIIKTKEDLDNKFNELYNFSSEESITKYIDGVSDDKKVRKLFKDYMLSIDANNYFDDCNTLLKKKQEEIDTILDTSRDVFYFLVVNNGKWLIKDDQIQFANNSLKQQYDDYIAKIK